MIRLLVTLLVLVAAVWVAKYSFDDTDYVVIGYGEWVTQTSLTVFVGLLVVTFVPCYLLVRAALTLWRGPRSLKAWRGDRKYRKAQETLARGLTALAEARWKEVERRSIRAVELGANSLLGYLTAARAAQALGEHGRRDNYLRAASSARPSSPVAVGLTQAELQLDDQQHEQALATLLQLRSQAPSNAYVLTQLRALFESLRDWQNLLELIPVLRQRKLVSPEDADALELKAMSELLIESAAASDTSALSWRWESVPKSKRLLPEVLEIYTELMLARGEPQACEALLRASLARDWNDRLAYLYGLVEGADPKAQLKQAEGWLRSHPENPDVLLTLGRLSARNRLWGKARSYLDASIAIEPRSESYKVAADLLDDLGEAEAAASYARKGLALVSARGRYVDELAVRPDAADSEPKPRNESAAPDVALPLMGEADARQG